MGLSEIISKLSYALLFGFIGIILGIWFSTVLYNLIGRSVSSGTEVTFSVLIVVIISLLLAFSGFRFGKTAME